MSPSLGSVRKLCWTGCFGLPISGVLSLPNLDLGRWLCAVPLIMAGWCAPISRCSCRLACMPLPPLWHLLWAQGSFWLPRHTEWWMRGYVIIKKKNSSPLATFPHVRRLISCRRLNPSSNIPFVSFSITLLPTQNFSTGIVHYTAFPWPNSAPPTLSQPSPQISPPHYWNQPPNPWPAYTAPWSPSLLTQPPPK